MLATRNQGLILVIVLWIITLLTMLASSLVYSLRTETLLATHAVERAQAQALAQAGLDYAALRILGANPQRKWPVDGSSQRWRFGSAALFIRVSDASGKIDINGANRELLKALLASAGVADEEVDSLVDAIEDWRDADDLPRVNGAESEAYEAAGRSVGPKNKPFESVEELQQVLGINAIFYKRIAEKITVFSRQPGINPAVASADVLRVLPDVDAATVEDYLLTRAEHFAQQLPAPPLPVNSTFISTAQGIAYHVAVNARLESGVTALIKAVIAQPRRRNEAYHVLAWREGI